MTRKVLMLLWLSPVLAAAAQAAAVEPCPLTRAAPPQESAPMADCLADAPYPPYCTDLPDGIRVCKCVAADENACADESGGMMRVERAGALLGSWCAVVSVQSATGEFDTLTGDLDGDGDAELIVANHEATSNGMGVSYWTVAIVEQSARFETPLTLTVKDYGLGTLARHAGAKGCQLLVTDWVNHEDPVRGWGMYFIGRWFQYAAGKLLAAETYPALARRYLNSFEEERWADIGEGFKGAPLKWLTNAKAEFVRADWTQQKSCGLTPFSAADGGGKRIRIKTPDLPDPPMLVHNKKTGKSCRIEEGGLWNGGGYLSRDEKTLVLEESSGSTETLAFFDTTDCTRIAEVNVTGDYDTDGDWITYQGYCECYEQACTKASCTPAAVYFLDEECRPVRYERESVKLTRRNYGVGFAELSEVEYPRTGRARVVDKASD